MMKNAIKFIIFIVILNLLLTPYVFAYEENVQLDDYNNITKEYSELVEREIKNTSSKDNVENDSLKKEQLNSAGLDNFELEEKNHETKSYKGNVGNKGVYYEIEPNDFITDANSIKLDDYNRGSITDYYYDVDCYKLEIKNAGTLNIYGYFYPSSYVYNSMDLGIVLVDKYDNIITFADYDWTEDLQYLQVQVVPGTYYIKAFQTSDYEYLYVDEIYDVRAFMTDSVSPNIPVTSVSLNKNNLTMRKGEQKTLIATIQPENATNQGLTWSSSNERVATVDQNGKVTAKDNGESIITVVTDEGNFKSSCKISVTSQTSDSKPTYRAVLIGNSNYGYNNNLSGPFYDVERMKEVLSKSRFGNNNIEFSSIDIIRDASKQETLNGIRNMLFAADENDVSYFYYSGHGKYNEITQAAYLSPVDSNLGDNDISADELESVLNEISGTKVVIIDSCYSGGFINKDAKDSVNKLSMFNDSIIRTFSKKITSSLNKSSYKVLTATASNENAVENYEFGWGYGGVFTNYFVQGCGYNTNYYPANKNYDNKISLNEIYQYTRGNVNTSHVQVYPENDNEFEIIGIPNISIPVEGITLDQTSLTLEQGEDRQLTFEIMPANATNNNATWFTSDSKIVTVDDSGIIYAKGIGTANVKVKTEDGNFISTCKVSVITTESDNFIEWKDVNGITNDVDLDKNWTIVFNKEVLASTVNNNNIYIRDTYDQNCPCSVSLLNNRKSILVSPEENYFPDTLYKLFINKNLRSTDNNSLTSGIVMNFTTASDVLNESEQALNIVQYGSFDAYQEMPLMIAFEEFFGDPSWEYFLSTDDENVVEFIGDCYYGDEPVKVLIQFLVDVKKNTFEVCYVEQNGIPLEFEEWDALLEAIYDNFTNEKAMLSDTGLWKSMNISKEEKCYVNCKYHTSGGSGKKEIKYFVKKEK